MHNEQYLNSADGSQPIVKRRPAEQLYADHQQQIYRQTDRMFAVLMGIQWIAGIVAALIISPRTWIGQTSEVNLNVWAAVFLGGVISFFPIVLAVLRPGHAMTRYTIAVGQMLMSSLLIHLTGGRIETHFHVFGSLAFLSFYRDWRVLVPATIVVALDHMVRGIFYPASVFGILTPEKWRWLEHAGWVIFEDIFLVLSCLRGQREMHQIAENTAKLDASEARYRIVTDSASDAIVTIDEAGTILFVNQSAEKMFGYTVEELLSEKFVKLMPERMHGRHDTLVRRYVTNKRSSALRAIETTARHKNGNEFLIEISFGQYSSEGEKIFTAVVRDITERKRTEEALRKSEEYRNLFKLASDAIIIFEPKTERVLDVNDYACKMYGYQRDELVGRCLKDIFRTDRSGNGQLARSLDHEAVESLESVHHQKNGTPIHILMNSSTIEFEGKSAVLSINRDITSRVRTSNALRESENKHRTLIENMSEGLVHLDREDRIIFTNKRFCEMIGYSEDALIGQNASQLLLDDEGRKIIERANRHRREGVSENYELQLRTAEGAMIWSLVGAVPTTDENGNIIGSMSVHTDITERKRAEEQLLHNALHDSLTGLPNRSLFLEYLRRAMNRSPRHEKSFAVLFLDFDGFKLINDSLGHLEGDNLLKLISRRLESVLRGEDVVARLGGDEFTILLNELTDAKKDALFVVERIHELLRKPFDLDGRQIFITVSIGVSLRNEKYKTPEEMLRDADIAMYRAKASGKGRHEIFSQAMHEQVSHRLLFETELRQAFERDEFSVFYQPIMELSTNQLIGFEALTRWFHPERGLIMPNEFIPICEEIGLIIPLGEWVLRESCRQVRDWQKRFEDRRDLSISVNLSCKQFMQFDLAERVAEILQETCLEARYLRLEVTESHVMENSHTAITIMNRLRELGVRLSIDDFGTGYSSLSHLQRLPIDYLKIDRSFINLMNAKHENGEIVRAIVMLAKNLNMQVIAEGVETEEQAMQLIDLDCAFAQGFLYSKPTNAERAEEILQTFGRSMIIQRVQDFNFDSLS